MLTGLISLLAVMWAIGTGVARAIEGSRQAATPRRPLVTWYEVATALGLTYETSTSGEDGLRGVLKGFRIKVDTQTTWVGSSWSIATRLAVKRTVEMGFERIPASLTLHARGPAGVRPSPEDVRTGDEGFDRAVQVQGPVIEALSMLTAPAREAVLHLVALNAQITVGEIVVLEPRAVTSVPELKGILMQLVDQAAPLCGLAEGGGPSALASNVRSDPNPAVAVRNLEVLESLFPKSAEAHEALTQALASQHPEVRFAAAIQVPPRHGLPVLDALLGNPAASTTLRLQVLQHLARTKAFPFGHVSEGVHRALGDPATTVRRAAIQLVGKVRDESQRGALTGIGVPQDAEEAKALALAMTSLGGAEAAPSLLRLLGHVDAGVRREAAQGLGTVGTIEAVEPLSHVTGGLLGGDLKDVAQAAILRIQARQGRTEQGRLALVETMPSAGSLSLAAAEGGELAVVVDETRSSGPDSGEPPRRSLPLPKLPGSS